MKARKLKPLAERFWSKVDKRGPDECWNWTATLNNRGYGQLGENARLVYAHRVSWKLNAGPIPAGVCVLHRCDNRPCVNPAHLFLGTQADNMADMARKGRADRLRKAKGEQCWNARLSVGDVSYIRSPAVVGLTDKDLSRYFGVSEATVNHARSGRSWKSIMCERNAR